MIEKTRDEFFTSFTWENADFNGILSSRFTQVLSFWFKELKLKKIERRNMVTKKKERNSVDEIYLRFDGARARPGCSFVETTTNEQHWPEGSSRQRHQLR